MSEESRIGSDNISLWSKVLLLCLAAFGFLPASAQQPWKRHVIDDAFRGADGVRLADFDGDGLQDIVTGWEQSGTVRLYLHPGHGQVTAKWPAVTVGKAGSPEDAVPFDFDGDGLLDVVSCHEGKTRQVIVHQNVFGADRTKLIDSDSWRSTPLTQIDGQMWMFAEPVSLTGNQRGLAVGSKGGGGSITLLIAPAVDAGSAAGWSVRKLRDAGWIMTLKSLDMDGDGDQDILFSDRKGSRRGVGWLEQPNDSPTEPWIEHQLGGQNHEVMFIDATDSRLLVSTRNSVFIDLRRQSDGSWHSEYVSNPPGVPLGKAIKRLSDDLIVFTANTAADKQADPKRPGIWLRDAEQGWSPIDSTTAIKPDRIECLDLDGDGDLDLLTCEERKNLGVIWYENPGLGKKL